MSIVAVQSVTLLGMTREKERILEDLQELGCLHLRSLREDDESLRPLKERLSEETREAWRFLNDCPRKRIRIGLGDRYDPVRMQKRALEIKREIETLSDEEDFLVQRIADVREWGDFDFSPDEKMGGHHLWFYVVPHYLLPKVEATGVVYEMVNRNDRFAYVVVIAPEEPVGMPVERIHIGSLSLTQLERRREEVALAIDELQEEREGLTRGLEVYERNMARLEDNGTRAEAMRMTRDEDPVFALQAWIPRHCTDEVRAYAGERGLAIRIEDPAPEEEPPTLLANPERWQVGENLVQFYMTPNYRLWDPSLIVLFSFTLFFAMIISDAGYGLLMVFGLILFRKRLSQSPGLLRLRQLLVLLSLSTVVWGVMVGSYFGVAPSGESFFATLHVLDLNNMDAMMKLSILVGAGHVILANAMDGWRQRDSLSALAPVGWIVAIIGGLVMASGQEALKTPGGIALGIGLLLVFGFAGAVPGEGTGKRLAGGLLSLTRITNAFGDILSYLRLFALGLASASLAVAFNGLAAQARDSIGTFGILVAILILIIGHTLNFVLAIVSGVVHGLRLNLIEFFNWSVPEEGRPFRFFHKKEKTT